VEDRRSYIKEIVLKALKEISTADKRNQSTSFLQSKVQDMTELDNFFSFMEKPSEDIADNDCNIAKLELLRYSGDNDSQIQNTTKYKYIKRLFLKYNTPIPPFAPIERSYSFARLILCQRRSSLNHENFKRCTMLF
jgi:hypothetical protein